jgi:hypothetical protein
MVGNLVAIALETQLQTMNRALDRMDAEVPLATIEETVGAMMEAVRQRRISDAAAVLERALQTDAYWLRGYLLLATIYERGDGIAKAMATIERGLGACANGIRLFSASRWIKAVVGLNGPVVHGRIRRHRERFERYERMFRHRMALLLARSGRVDEASDASIESWLHLECEHDA